MITSTKQPLLIPVATLLVAWGVIIVFINPVGDFMINDDWSFIVIIESLLTDGKIMPTGWGGGGPAVLSHVGWGMLFSALFGYSPTTLRISVLTLAILGTLALLILLFQLLRNKPLGIGLAALFTLLFNPLFLSQSFTFMTDITFTALVIFSLLLLHLGIENERWSWLLSGLLFSLLATLTRQIGLFLPVSFSLGCLLHPKASRFNLKKILLFTFLIAVVPWFLFEVFLWQSGSTPLIHSPVFQKVFLNPITKGFPDYLFFLFYQAGIILTYTGFFLSPLFFLQFRQLFSHEAVRRFGSLFLIIFLIFEASIIGGLIDPPTGFYQNVLYNFGIGPLLLKDTYLLGVVRTMTLPKPLFYLLVFWSIFSAAALIFFSCQFLNSFFKNRSGRSGYDTPFISLLAFIGVIVYSGVILLTGFHDRYLIPPCVLLILWFVPQIKINRNNNPFPIILSTVILLFLAGTTVFGLKDFMSTKRSLHKAHNYLVNTINVDPCDIDGGFEFNGYYCRGINRMNRSGKYSWWWVEQEKYLVSLGPLQDYRTVKTFPFSRTIGPDGAIHILQPVK